VDIIVIKMILKHNFTIMEPNTDCTIANINQLKVNCTNISYPKLVGPSMVKDLDFKDNFINIIITVHINLHTDLN
jgi:hypothetical protein